MATKLSIVGSSSPSYVDQLDQAAGKVPRTNAGMLALLDAFGQLPLDGDDVAAYFVPIQRLRWRSHGYNAPGDKFAAATNAAWYRKPYVRPDEALATLRAVATASDRFTATLEPPEGPVLIVVDNDLVNAKPAAIAHELAESWDSLKTARADDVEPNAPAPAPVEADAEDGDDAEPATTPTAAGFTTPVKIIVDHGPAAGKEAARRLEEERKRLERLKAARASTAKAILVLIVIVGLSQLGRRS